ncbi:MAG: SPASM domain-containing protein [Candidatus Azambacteria bacterium]|nr:SPASM domain-containing protein [Candidatus Azambacteria bacterium]
MIESREGKLIYHSLQGNPTIIDNGAKEILEIFLQPQSIDSFLANYELDDESRKALIQLVVNGFLVHPYKDTREIFFKKVSKKIHNAITGKELRVLDLSVSELCNFRCHYCIHSRAIKLDKSRIGHNGLMNIELSKTAIDVFLTHLNCCGIKTWDLHFGSAESLLNFKVIKWVIGYLETIGHLPENISLNSNFSLLTREMVEFFRDKHFHLNTSIDGLPEVSDLVRVYKNGSKTSYDIIQGLDLIKEIGHQVNGVGITLCDENFNKVNTNIIDWLKDYNVPNILFDIDFVNMVSLDPEEAADKITDLEIRCREVGILAEGVWKTPYKNIRDSGISGISRFCASLMGNNLLVTPSGNLYICSYSATPLGHINEFPDCLKTGSFGKILINSSVANFSECEDCELEGHCLGGCFLTREGGKNQNRKIAQMCAFYKAVTRKLLALDIKGGELYEKNY